MAAPPVFVAEYHSTYNTTTDPKAVSVTVDVGDVLCIVALTEDSLTTLGPPSGGGLTYFTAESIEEGSYTAAYAWHTGPAALSQTFDVTIAKIITVGSLWWGFTVLRFSGSSGGGASAKYHVVSGAPSSPGFATTQNNSAVVVVNGDWNAVDGASRTWRTVNAITPTSPASSGEVNYFRDGSHYGAYAGYWSDVGAYGSADYGLSAPGAQKYALIAVEIRGFSDVEPPDLYLPGGMLPPPLLYEVARQQIRVDLGDDTSPARTPPVFTDAQDLAIGTGTRAFTAVTTQAGDYLVVEVVVENNAANSGMAPSGGGLTYAPQGDTGTTNPNSHTRAIQWTALDAAGDPSRTVTITPDDGTQRYRARLTVVHGSEGPGATVAVQAGQKATMTMTADYSAVFTAVGDWSAGAVGAPVWMPAGSTVASELLGGVMTAILGRWDNNGGAGAAVFGIRTPTYGTPSIAVLEMLGAAVVGGGGANVDVDAALTETSTIDATAAVDRVLDAALVETETIDATAAVTVVVDAAITETDTITATASVTTPPVDVDAALTETQALAATVAVDRAVDAALTETQTIAATAAVDRALNAALTETQTLAGTVRVDPGVAAALVETETLASSAMVTHTVDAALVETNTLTATASIVGQVTADAALTETETTAATAAVTRPVDAALAETSTIASTATVARALDAALTETETLAATAAATYVLDATLVETETLAATARVDPGVDAALTDTSMIVATVALDAGVSHECATDRPSSGLTVRPGTGVTARPGTGTTDNPC